MLGVRQVVSRRLPLQWDVPLSVISSGYSRATCEFSGTVFPISFGYIPEQCYFLDLIIARLKILEELLVHIR